MQYLVTAYDGKDSGAAERRKNARQRHLAGVARFIEAGKHLYAVAILDEAGDMIGSVMVVDFPSREALEREWLDSEPYITENVWKEVEIRPCKVPGLFQGK